MGELQVADDFRSIRGKPPHEVARVETLGSPSELSLLTVYYDGG